MALIRGLLCNQDMNDKTTPKPPKLGSAYEQIKVKALAEYAREAAENLRVTPHVAKQVQEIRESMSATRRMAEMLDGMSATKQMEGMLQSILATNNTMAVQAGAVAMGRMGDTLHSVSVRGMLEEATSHMAASVRIGEVLHSITVKEMLEEATGRMAASVRMSEMLKNASLTSQLQEMADNFLHAARPGMQWEDLRLKRSNAATSPSVEYVPPRRDGDRSETNAARAQNDADSTAATIAQAVEFQQTINITMVQVVNHLQAQPGDTAKTVMLAFIFWKFLDYLLSGIVGSVLSFYTPAVLGDNAQIDKKSVQQVASVAGVPREMLMGFRYVSTSILFVRQNPRANSPEIGQLRYGTYVQVLKKDKDFALVLWEDVETGTLIQGWVFARYLSRPTY